MARATTWFGLAETLAPLEFVSNAKELPAPGKQEMAVAESAEDTNLLREKVSRRLMSLHLRAEAMVFTAQ